MDTLQLDTVERVAAEMHDAIEAGDWERVMLLSSTTMRDSTDLRLRPVWEALFAHSLRMMQGAE